MSETDGGGMSDTPRTDGIHQKNIKSTDQNRTGLDDYISMMKHAQTLERQNAELLAALKEVCTVLESETQAIVDTLWVSGGKPETLLDHCREAIRRAEG